jgi:uncharacterized protein YpiB (UPF0302 family)
MEVLSLNTTMMSRAFYNFTKNWECSLWISLHHSNHQTPDREIDQEKHNTDGFIRA